MGGKILAIGTLFVIGLMFADALTHPSGVNALGQSSLGLLQVGGNQLLGVKATYGNTPA